MSPNKKPSSMNEEGSIRSQTGRRNMSGNLKPQESNDNLYGVVIEAQGGNPQTGKCLCPAHNDSNPSLHVSEGRDGRLLLYCFAGCPYEKIVNALARKGIHVRSGKRTSSTSRSNQATT